MNLNELLVELRQGQIKVWVEGDKLNYQAAPGALSPDLLAHLKQRKGELMAFLRTLGTGRETGMMPIKPAGAEAAPQLSFAQQRLWFWDQLHPGSLVYNMSKAWQLTGRLEREALERSFDEIVRRHAGLRCRITTHDGKPVLTIDPELKVPLEIEAQPDLEGAEREALIEAWCRARVQRPFDLSRGPLVRLGLLQLGATDHVLLLTMHHIISDGWSMDILGRELSVLYDAYAQGKAVSLPALPLTYTDYAHWQRQWMHGPMMAKQLAYWKQQLAPPLPALHLPMKREEAAVNLFHGASHNFTVSRSAYQALQQLCRQAGTTLFITLLAGFKALLYRLTGQGDLAVGTPIAGRNQAELEPLIGLFVNTLVMRTQVDGSLNFKQLLARVREAALGAYENQDLPFDKLVEELNPQRQPGQNPLFQVMFILQNMPAQDLQLAGAQARTLRYGPHSSLFDLTMVLEEGPAGLQGELEYSTDLFSAESMARLMGNYQRLLEAWVQQPGLPLSRVPLFNAEERR